jgi:hypothetical protein
MFLETSGNWRWNLSGGRDLGDIVEYWSRPGIDPNAKFYLVPTDAKLPTGENLYMFSPAGKVPGCLGTGLFDLIKPMYSVIAGATSGNAFKVMNGVVGLREYGINFETSVNSCHRADNVGHVYNPGGYGLSFRNEYYGRTSLFTIICDSCGADGNGSNCTNCRITHFGNANLKTGMMESSNGFYNGGCVSGPHWNGGQGGLRTKQGKCDRWGIRITT